MKLKDIVEKYGVDENEFTNWIQRTSYKYDYGMWSGALEVSDKENIEGVIDAFKHELAERPRLERERQENAARVAAAQEEKQKAHASMLITSGFSFEGYTITKYSGYISGDDAVQVDRKEGLFQSTDVGAKLMDSLVQIRRNALNELKEAAYALGCNAVIGVDFDYLTLDPQVSSAMSRDITVYLPYVFGVTANGNAVVIEKN